MGTKNKHVAHRKLLTDIRCLASSLLSCFSPLIAKSNGLGKPKIIGSERWDRVRSDDFVQITPLGYVASLFFFLIRHQQLSLQSFEISQEDFPTDVSSPSPRSWRCSEEILATIWTTHNKAPLTKQPLPSANWGLERRPEEGGWGSLGRKGRKMRR